MLQRGMGAEQIATDLRAREKGSERNTEGQRERQAGGGGGGG